MAISLSTIRIIAFGTVIFFSLIVLGLNARVTNITETYLSAYFIFAALSIATAVLSLVTLPVMIAVDLTRKGAFTSMIAFEVGWLGVLWILWLASAIKTSQVGQDFKSSCNYGSGTRRTEVCHEVSAIQALDYLSWLILLGYTGVLFVFATSASLRGLNVWAESVKSAEAGGGIPIVVGQQVQQQVQQPQNMGVAQPTIVTSQWQQPQPQVPISTTPRGQSSVIQV